MRKFWLSTLVCLLSAPAFAGDTVIIAPRTEGRVIELPGNAKYRTGGGGGAVVLYNDYEARDYLYRRLVNPNAEPPRSWYRYPPRNYTGNAGAIISTCGKLEREAERRRCQNDMLEIQRKYND